MVAQYAQACNLFAGPELPHKLDVLRGHCEALGTDYDATEDRDGTDRPPAPTARTWTPCWPQFEDLHKLGVHHVHGRIPDVHDLRRIQILGEKVIPVIAEW